MRYLLLILLLILPLSAQARDVLPGPVQGEVLGVLDGDTVTVRLHIWIGQELETHVRLYGIDAPELHGRCASERSRAQAAKAALAALLEDGRISLYDIKLEKYAGRVLAKAQNSQGVGLSQRLLEEGLVRPYAGRKRLSWCS